MLNVFVPLTSCDSAIPSSLSFSIRAVFTLSDVALSIIKQSRAVYVQLHPLIFNNFD